MDCKSANEIFTNYLDNELNDSERMLLEEHLNTCETCKTSLEEFKAIIAICKDISDEELPEDFKENLHKKLIAAEMHKGSQIITENKKDIKKKLVGFAGVLSSVAAIVLVFVFIKGLTGFGGMGSKSSDMRTAELAKAEAPRMEEAIKEEPKKEEMKKSVYADESKPAESKADNSATAYDMATQAVGNAAPASKDTGGGQKAFTAQSNGSSDGTANKSITSEPMAKKAEVLDTTVKAAISNYSTGVEILSEKPDIVINEIRNLAAENGAENVDALYGTKEAVRIMADSEGSVLNLKVSNTKLAQFEDTLKKKYPESQMKFDEIKANDVTSQINELNTSAVNIQNRISVLEAENNSNTEEFANLKNEKEQIQQRINTLIADSEYTLVRIVVKKKQ